MINKVIKLKLQYLNMFMYKLHVKETQKCMRYAIIPKYILIPNLGFLPQIIYRYALGPTLLELKPEVKVTVTWNQLVTPRAQDVSTYQIWNCYHKEYRRSAVSAIFQDLTPEIKVTVAENSEPHSMTPTYIHKLNFLGNMSYSRRHALNTMFCLLSVSCLVGELFCLHTTVVITVCYINRPTR